MADHKTWKKQHVDELRKLLAQSAKLRRRQVLDGELTPGQHMMGLWQTARLETTYADLAATARYAAAVEFFKTDLYGARDFSQRDSDFERIYPVMVKFLSDGALLSVITAMELQTLTQSLDLKMAEVLIGELGAVPERGAQAFTAEQYAAAYRICDNQADRIRQVELVYRAGEILDDVVKKPMIYRSVRLARKPAQMAGFGELQSFIERGFKAFRNMRGAREFIDTIRERELFIIEQIFSGEAADTWARRGAFATAGAE